MTLAQATILGSVSNDSSLPQIVYADAIAGGAHVPEFIDGATEDYLFDRDYSAGGSETAIMRSRVSGHSLTQVGTPPDPNANHIIVGAGINGLLMAADDATTNTYAAIFKMTNPVGAVSVMSADTTTIASAGTGLFQSSTLGFGLAMRPGAPDPGITGAAGDAVFDVNNWCFIAASMDGTNITLFVGAPTPLVSTTALSMTPAGKLGIGKVSNLGFAYDDMPLSVHRAAAWAGRGLSIAELTAVYKRWQVVAARRAITVV